MGKEKINIFFKISNSIQAKAAESTTTTTTCPASHSSAAVVEKNVHKMVIYKESCYIRSWHKGYVLFLDGIFFYFPKNQKRAWRLFVSYVCVHKKKNPDGNIDTDTDRQTHWQCSLSFRLHAPIQLTCCLYEGAKGARSRFTTTTTSGWNNFPPPPPSFFPPICFLLVGG
jgi:hypothetical protein